MHERSRLVLATCAVAAVGVGTLLVLTVAYRLHKAPADQSRGAGRRPPRPARVPPRVAAPPAHPRARRTASANGHRDLAGAMPPIDDYAF